MPMGEHAGHQMAMTGALGSYPMERESSGTAWQPDTSEHMGLHAMSGDWTLMAHGVLNLVYDHQSRPARRRQGVRVGHADGHGAAAARQRHAAVQGDAQPRPADGAERLSAAARQRRDGERPRPADRPPAPARFLHGAVGVGLAEHRAARAACSSTPGFRASRRSGRRPSCTARRSWIRPRRRSRHHWLDSTHISFGVVTAGVVLDRVKVEVSRFNGREPDQHRWNIETGPLDSTAVRVSWNPTRDARAAGELGAFHGSRTARARRRPEALVGKRALWPNEVAPGWKLAGTLAWGRKIGRPTTTTTRSPPRRRSSTRAGPCSAAAR